MKDQILIHGYCNNMSTAVTWVLQLYMGTTNCVRSDGYCDRAGRLALHASSKPCYCRVLAGITRCYRVLPDVTISIASLESLLIVRGVQYAYDDASKV
eukprot:3490-Amorphochlora_amoeboformis.AAC.1